jgi:hypothetical protein
MKKSRKLILSRETLHSLELRDVSGAAQTLLACGGGTTTRDTNTSNPTGFTCDTNGVCSSDCSTGGACTT